MGKNQVSCFFDSEGGIIDGCGVCYQSKTGTQIDHSELWEQTAD